MSEEAEELNNVIMEIRRCLNFFSDETETTLFVEDENGASGYLLDEENGHRYKITVEKLS